VRCRSPKAQWTGVGRMAARLGHSLSQALTNRDAKIDAWITSGFKSMERKINKREREALGSADTFALVKSKLGI
jgi:phage shock protein A